MIHNLYKPSLTEISYRTPLPFEANYLQVSKARAVTTTWVQDETMTKQTKQLEYGFVRFAKHCTLFLFTCYTGTQLFWYWCCTKERKKETTASF